MFIVMFNDSPGNADNWRPVTHSNGHTPAYKDEADATELLQKLCEVRDATQSTTAYKVEKFYRDIKRLDATPGASPMWWRGHYHGANGLSKKIIEIVHEENPLAKFGPGVHQAVDPVAGAAVSKPDEVAPEEKPEYKFSILKSRPVVPVDTFRFENTRWYPVFDFPIRYTKTET